MKKTLAVLGIVAVAAGAFAQGKVNFVNDSDRLVTWTTETAKLKPADVALAGQAVPANSTFKAALYYNTSGGSASPVAESALVAFGTTTLLSTSPGFITGGSATLSSPVAVPAGQFGTFQVRVWEASFATYDAAFTGGGYTGKSIVFTSLTGSFTPLGINNQAGGASGSSSGWNPGPVYVSLVPEPSSLALAGLGAAALLIFRRRK